MSLFAILVTVRLKPGSAGDFEPLIRENAQAAVREEPACHLFHVMRSIDDGDVFHFYEVYDNAAALDVHREQPHFKRYSEAAAALILERTVQPVDVLNPGNIADELTR